MPDNFGDDVAQQEQQQSTSETPVEDTSSQEPVQDSDRTFADDSADTAESRRENDKREAEAAAASAAAEAKEEKSSAREANESYEKVFHRERRAAQDEFRETHGRESDTEREDQQAREDARAALKEKRRQEREREREQRKARENFKSETPTADQYSKQNESSKRNFAEGEKTPRPREPPVGRIQRLKQSFQNSLFSVGKAAQNRMRDEWNVKNKEAPKTTHDFEVDRKRLKEKIQDAKDDLEKDPKSYDKQQKVKELQEQYDKTYDEEKQSPFYKAKRKSEMIELQKKIVSGRRSIQGGSTGKYGKGKKADPLIRATNILAPTKGRSFMPANLYGKGGDAFMIGGGGRRAGPKRMGGGGDMFGFSRPMGTSMNPDFLGSPGSMSPGGMNPEFLGEGPRGDFLRGSSDFGGSMNPEFLGMGDSQESAPSGKRGRGRPRKNTSAPGFIAAAHGFHGVVEEPTILLTGEGGEPERVDVKPLHRKNVRSTEAPMPEDSGSTQGLNLDKFHPGTINFEAIGLGDQKQSPMKQVQGKPQSTGHEHLMTINFDAIGMKDEQSPMKMPKGKQSAPQHEGLMSINFDAIGMHHEDSMPQKTKMAKGKQSAPQHEGLMSINFDAIGMKDEQSPMKMPKGKQSAPQHEGLMSINFEALGMHHEDSMPQKTKMAKGKKAPASEFGGMFDPGHYNLDNVKKLVGF